MKFSILTVIAGTLFCTGSTLAQVPKVEFAAWKACVMAAAERFERTGETAEAIAKAALIVCRPTENKMVDEMMEQKVDLVRRTGIAETLAKRLTEEVIVLIMESRARKR